MMKFSAISIFTQILDDATHLLKSTDYIFKKTQETSPYSYDLSFVPTMPENIVEKVLRSNSCTLCDRRMSYKPSQFREEKVLQPYLVLIHNIFIDPLPHPNRKKKYFQDSITNDWFHSFFLEVFENSPENFLVREVLRCHFGKEDIKKKKWVDQCHSHIKKDIIQHDIKGILVLGEAAPLLFEKKMAQENIGNVIQFADIPTVISSGPGKLTYFQKNNFSKDVLKVEKEKIFKTLLVFKNKVMGK